MVLAVLTTALGSGVCAQDTTQVKAMDLYGQVMMDMGYNAGAIGSDWFDVMRPTQLPGFKDQYGTEGNFFIGVRQSNFGVKTYTPTAKGELFTRFEFGLFGTGADAGETTFRLRHAYAQLGKWKVGQVESPFMDLDVAPNSLDGWGPNAMVFFRNVLLCYMPIQGDTRMSIALERPGASSDQGPYGELIAAQGIAPRLAVPDLSAEYRQATKFGYVELAGIARHVAWEDLVPDSLDLDGSALCWGVNLSTNVVVRGNTTVRFQVVYGQGIQNYLNDATADIGVRTNEGNPTTPIEGYALPVLGALLFVDHQWNKKLSSSLGYARVDMDNAPTAAANSFDTGGYATANVLVHPVQNVLWGVELQYGNRANFTDGWTYDAVKLQLSFRYKFSNTLYRPKKS